jgi:predicted alpha/beta-fold hydrolase
MMTHLRYSVLLAAALLSVASVRAFEAARPLDPITLPDAPDFTPIAPADLPDFGAELETQVSKCGRVNTNGLLATINYCEFNKTKPCAKEEIVVLAPEDTQFAKPVRVRAFFHGGKAPLAVTLLGFAEPADDRLARAWQAYLFDAGCHVLSFDSVILNQMNEASSHGVAGNVIEEAQVAAAIVDGFLKCKDRDGAVLRDRVSSVRLLGTSYGGTLALQTLRLPQARSWPVDRVLIVSTPVNMTTAARRLDKFAREDRPRWGILKMAKLLNGYTPPREQPTPEDESLMRAGIGYCFHGDLHTLAKSNISRYDPDLLERLLKWQENPEQRKMQKEMQEIVKQKQQDELAQLEKLRDREGEYRRAKEELNAKHKAQDIAAKFKPSDIGTWNFQDYVFLLLKPYWKMKRGTELAVTLGDLLKGAPNFVQVVIAADDPLNEPQEVAELRKKIPAPQLIVLPHGGHLGFTGTKWCQTLVGKLFQAKQSGGDAVRQTPPAPIAPPKSEPAGSFEQP